VTLPLAIHENELDIFMHIINGNEMPLELLDIHWNYSIFSEITSFINQFNKFEFHQLENNRFIRVWKNWCKWFNQIEWKWNSTIFWMSFIEFDSLIKFIHLSPSTRSGFQTHESTVGVSPSDLPQRLSRLSFSHLFTFVMSSAIMAKKSG